MSRAAVSELIARFDALSRRRELTPDESIQLQRLIVTERRYNSRRQSRQSAAQTS